MITRRLLLGSSGAALLPSTALGQSSDAPAPTSLEELAQRVVDLEDRVTDLESILAAESADVGGEDETVEASSGANADDTPSISGTGTTLSEAIYLESGLYRVDAQISVSNGFGDFFTLEVAGSDAFDDIIFMEFAEGNGEFEYSTNWTAARSEDYFFQIDCMSRWTVSFVRLR